MAQVLPVPGQHLAGLFSLSGKLLAEHATVTVHYGQRSQASGQANPGGLLALDWAQKQLKELLVAGSRRQAEMTSLGQELGLVTPRHIFSGPRKHGAVRAAPGGSAGHPARAVPALLLGGGGWACGASTWNGVARVRYPKDFKYESPKQPSRDAGCDGVERDRLVEQAPTAAMPAPPPAPAPAGAALQMLMRKAAVRLGAPAGEEAVHAASAAEISLKSWGS